jgi:predicted dienelactone hydrolase
MRRQVAAALAAIVAALALLAPSAASTPTARESFRVATTVVEVPVPAVAPAVLRTKVWYPATGRSGRLVPDRASAPYPLVVFSQGFDMAVSDYSSLLSHWAAAGFVVAAPTYPYTARPGPLDEADIVNHPAELRFVLAALIRAGRQPSSVLSGLVNAAEVGLAGHSDGGDVSLAVADNTCCRDPSVKALAVLSGAELSSFGGSYFAGPQVPLLVVQGSADAVNVPACSAQIYDEAKGLKYYLDLLGAGHLAPYVEEPHDSGAKGRRDDRYRSIVAAVTTDFFEAELSGKRGALALLERAGKVPGVAKVVAGGRVPVAGGSCPGSPA